MYQIMPNRFNFPRIKPNVITCTGLGNAGYVCAYFRNSIKNFTHYERDGCHHRMHGICLVNNMLENGISEAGTLFCPQCLAEGR